MPEFDKIAPLRVEFSINDSLSNTGYSIGQLTTLYLHYLNTYWHRFIKNFHRFEVTISHITFWRAQLRWLGSDLVRREWITREALNEHIRFSYREPATQQFNVIVDRTALYPGNWCGPIFLSHMQFGVVYKGVHEQQTCRPFFID